MKLHLETNIAEGTPEELVEYLRLVEGNSSDNQLVSLGYAHRPDEETLKSLVGSLVKVDKEYTDSTEEAEEPSKEFQVGDKVKVLESACGAVGEATVTAVHENGEVEIAGTSSYGTYLTDWGSHTSFLEKVEEEEDVEVDPEELDGLLGYRYWYWYLDTANFNKFVVLKAGANYFEDSIGKRYTYQAVSGYVKPVDREDVYVKFEDAERKGALLSYYPTVDIFQISY